MNLQVRFYNENRLIVAIPLYYRIIFLMISLILISAMIVVKQYSFLSFFMLAGGLLGSGYFERWEFNKTTDCISQTLGWIVPFHRKTIPLSKVTSVIITQTKGAGKRRMLSRISLQLDDRRQLVELAKRESRIASSLAGFLALPLIEE